MVFEWKLKRLAKVTNLQSNLHLNYSRCCLFGAVQRMNSVLYHQQRNLLQIYNQILNQSTKIHLSLMPQYPISQFMLLHFRNVDPRFNKNIWIQLNTKNTMIDFNVWKISKIAHTTQMTLTVTLCYDVLIRSAQINFPGSMLIIHTTRLISIFTQGNAHTVAFDLFVCAQRTILGVRLQSKN